ncbi:MAG: DivIVA domain-containing protein [Cyclobacteriaceae bacterium]|nr:DivIVA domain-containing protein [Cyclobacteriaceae bacterium]MCH8515154.1 DivIVA domain-containing protein [Cyclobacteriaceae bacterium]
MKITPLEIRQKDFEKGFRGYDKDEVEAFLLSLSQEWEKLLDENKELKYKLQVTEREVEKLREVESSLFKTLKTAEDTGANMIDHANKTAEIMLKEARMKSNGIISESKNKARDVIEETEYRVKQMVEEMQETLKTLEQSCKSLENQRDDVAEEIKNFAQNMVEKAVRLQRSETRNQLKKTVADAQNLSRSVEEEPQWKKDINAKIDALEVIDPGQTSSKSQKTEENKDGGSDKNNQSFFDGI